MSYTAERLSEPHDHGRFDDPGAALRWCGAGLRWQHVATDGRTRSLLIGYQDDRSQPLAVVRGPLVAVLPEDVDVEVLT